MRTKSGITTRRFAAISVVSLSLCLRPAVALAQREPLSVPAPGTPATQQLAILKDVRVDQRLDNAIPLSLPFVDENGKDVTLGTYFGTRPVVLALVYYQCPMLCTLVMDGLTSSLTTLNLNAGKDFDVVVVSFNPGEPPSLAANAKASTVKRYARPGTDGGFHFLTGRQESIEKLADAVGFRYTWDPKISQYAHPAAITVLTPAGHVSRYFFGVEYSPRDLRLGMVEASGGKIGNVLDQALLYCYHYDPFSGKYGLALMSLIRLGGVLTFGVLGVSIFVALRRERRRANAAGVAATGAR
jgi:protein SCO1/2